MKILLMHLNPSGKTLQLGLSYIASSLQARGHSISFLPLCGLDKTAIANEVFGSGVRLVLISVTSAAFELCKRVVRFINGRSSVPVVLGGIHPTICPAECLELKGVLGLCIGEGEYAACDLADAMENNTDYTNIENLWVKKGDVVHRNSLRPLIKDLDALPLPNYRMFKGHMNLQLLPLFVTRGCPFKCSYCCNHMLQKLYAGKGAFLRYPSISYGMSLVRHALKQVPEAEKIEFYDDTFTLHKEWLRKFLAEFSKLGIKFVCNSRFDVIDEDTIRLLARSGCCMINIAVECGNERIRKDVLRRDIPDSLILEKSRLIKKYGIRLFTHNMIGIPYEMEEDILKTVKLNRDIEADIVQASVFNPYPKTDLGDLCETKGWIDARLRPASYFDFTVLKTPFIKPHVVNYYFLAFRSMVFDSGPRLYAQRALCWILHFRNNSIYLGLRRLKRKIKLTFSAYSLRRDRERQL